MKYLPYLLMPVMASLLVIAQAIWGSVIKAGALQGSLLQIATTLLTSWRMWLGAGIYIIATLLYFFLLSKLKFFSVQIPMTALAILLSLALSIIMFGEKPTLINSIGIAVVLVGVLLVLHR